MKRKESLQEAEINEEKEQENRRISISFNLEEIVELKDNEPIERRPSMMNRMTNHLRRFSEISELGMDQSLKGLAILLILVLIFIIFMYCFNWMDTYLFLFNFFKVEEWKKCDLTIEIISNW